MNKETRLRECPFDCGKREGLEMPCVAQIYSNSWVVECPVCMARRFGETKETAIKAWNARPTPDKIDVDKVSE